MIGVIINAGSIDPNADKKCNEAKSRLWGRFAETRAEMLYAAKKVNDACDRVDEAIADRNRCLDNLQRAVANFRQVQLAVNSHYGLDPKPCHATVEDAIRDLFGGA